MSDYGNDGDDENSDGSEYEENESEDPFKDPGGNDPGESQVEEDAKEFRLQQYLERIIQDTNNGTFTTQGAAAGFAISGS